MRFLPFSLKASLQFPFSGRHPNVHYVGAYCFRRAEDLKTQGFTLSRLVHRFVTESPLLLFYAKSPIPAELLTRHRLHICAAYLRKYCKVAAVSNVTLVCRRYRIREFYSSDLFGFRSSKQRSILPAAGAGNQ